MNQVICSDCREYMKTMQESSVDLVVTSPPYDDLRTYEGTLNWNAEVWQGVLRGLWRVIKQGGVVVWIVNDATVDGSETGTSFRQALFAKEIGFRLHDTMIYEKSGCYMPSNTRYLSSFEYVFVFSKGAVKTFNPIEDRKNRFSGDNSRWGKGRKVRGKDGVFSDRSDWVAKEYGRRFNIWRYSSGYGFGHSDNSAYEHPATFPEALAADHIRSWSNEGDLVFDPFCGSGTTGVAAQKLNRDFIGCEIVEKYAELSEKRIQAAKLPLFEQEERK